MSRLNRQTPILHQFDYRPNRGKTVALFTLALCGEILLVYFATTLNGPVNVRGFQLNQAQGRTLFGLLAGMSSSGLIALGCCVYMAFAAPRRIALTHSEIILPRPTRMGMSFEEIQIPLDSIVDASVYDFIGATKVLRLQHAGGMVSIPSNMLRSHSEFTDMCSRVRCSVSNATCGVLTAPVEEGGIRPQRSSGKSSWSRRD